MVNGLRLTIVVKRVQGTACQLGAANDVTQATVIDSMPTTVPATESQHGQPDEQARDPKEASPLMAAFCDAKGSATAGQLLGPCKGMHAQVTALAAALAALAVGEAVLLAQLSAVAGAAGRMQEARAAREREYCVQQEAAWLAALEENARHMRCDMHDRRRAALLCLHGFGAVVYMEAHRGSCYVLVAQEHGGRACSNSASACTALGGGTSCARACTGCTPHRGCTGSSSAGGEHGSM